MSSLHVMVDLETWSSNKNAVIISIGAVKFDPTGGGLVDRFHVGIDPSLTPIKGFDIDPKTMLWWLDPDRDDARREWLALEKIDLGTALWGFAEWLGQPSMPVWGNGATFDNVVLRMSYELMGLETPWSFRDDRCYRTLKNLAPKAVMPPQIGVQHSALVDAEWQAMHLQLIYRELGLA